VKTLPKGAIAITGCTRWRGALEGDSETVVFRAGAPLRPEEHGTDPEHVRLDIHGVNGTTKIELKTEYEIPQTLLGKLREPFVRKLNEREADIFLANLKDAWRSSSTSARFRGRLAPLPSRRVRRRLRPSSLRPVSEPNIEYLSPAQRAELEAELVELEGPGGRP
jgi:hypothetical protein